MEQYAKYDLFLFWDKMNDCPEILGEDGDFHSYGEDNVDGSRYWYKLNKFTDVTPLNDWERFDIFDPILGDWVPWASANDDLQMAAHKHAGNPEWNDLL